MSKYVWLSSISLILLGLSASGANRSGPSGQLLLANKGDSSLGIVNPQTDQQITTISEDGYTAHEVAASADGRLAFVPIYGSSGVGQPGTNGQIIDVMDLASGKIISKIDFGHGVRPHCAVLDRADGLLYVTTELDQQLAVIDPKTFKIIGHVPTDQPESHMLAISPDGKRGYTANVGPGTVSVLDLPNRKVIKIIQLVPKNVQRIAVSTDGKWVFTSDQTQPRLAVIDTSTNTLKTWVALPDVAYGTAVTPDGKWLLLTQPKTSKVAVLDLGTMKMTKTLDVPKSPQEIVVDPDGSKAYVSCSSSNKVAVINLATWQTETPIDAGKGVDGMSWAGQ
ncbi:MAG TPA: cytochrome D1 domain-containing protein [Candidatus Acidoferrales bacterium]